MTLSELLFRVEHKSGLNSSVPEERDMMVGWANDGVVRVLRKTKCFADVGEMTLTVGKDMYRTDSAILAVLNERVSSQNQLYDLEVVTLEEIMSRQRVGGTSPTQMIAIEGNLMVVYPTPSAADVITWMYVPYPAAKMSSDQDDPSSPSFGNVPEEAHVCIEAYMTYRAAEYDDKKFADTPDTLQKKFELECIEYRRSRRARRGRTPFAPRIGYPGKRNFGRKNDQDIVFYG